MRLWGLLAHSVFVLTPAVLLSQVLQEPPTFRAGVRAVEVDVLVTDGRGETVKDLTKDDFELFEDGVPQRITSVSFTDIPLVAQRYRSTKDSDAARSVGEGRVVTMFLGNARRAGPVAREFVNEVIGPRDQMAIISLLRSATPVLSFTSDRARMIAEIDDISPGGFHRFAGRSTSGVNPTRPADGIAGMNAGAAAYRVAERVFTQLGTLTGRRKVVVWIDPPAVFMSLTDVELMTAQRDALRAATRNNVAIYAVSSTGLTTALGLGTLAAKAAYRLLAEDTGGDAIVDSNNFSGAFQRFNRDISAYYLLTYQPEVEHADGKFHDIKVRVARPNVTVRARRGYYAPDPER